MAQYPTHHRHHPSLVHYYDHFQMKTKTVTSQIYYATTHASYAIYLLPSTQPTRQKQPMKSKHTKTETSEQNHLQHIKNLLNQLHHCQVGLGLHLPIHTENKPVRPGVIISRVFSHRLINPLRKLNYNSGGVICFSGCGTC